jgi:CRISPR/Cas system CMR-associated protein Cmr1 (group 7 of RAMP superfamily)
VVAKLVAKSLQEGIYPNCLKISRVTPIFKAGDRDDPKNYRPVSIIPILAKIFENVVHAHVSNI